MTPTNTDDADFGPDVIFNACVCGVHIDECGSCQSARDGNDSLLRAERARLTALSARNAVVEEALMAVPISNWVGLTIGDTKIRSWEEARAFLQRLIPLTTKETDDGE